MKDDMQHEIGQYIKTLRERKGMTQAALAKLLKTSQSAVARMESGNQNFTTAELLKVSDVLNHKLVAVKDSVDFQINGGKKLSGSIQTNTSKNGALHVMFAALINQGTTTIRNVPKIEEVHRVMELFKSIGIQSSWINNRDITITPPKKYNLKSMDVQAAKRIRSNLMIIGSMIHRQDKFSLPLSGGCKMGQRTIAAHQVALEELGVNIITTEKSYEISHSGLKTDREIVMYEMGDTATTNILIAAAGLPGTTTIRFAGSNYMVQDVCFFLEQLGVKIEGIGTANLVVHGKASIKEDVEVFISEDPIESMMFLSAAIVTESKLTITRCPIDFLLLELLKLKKMGLKYSVSKKYKAENGKTDLVDITVQPSKLHALQDKIHALPYPGINIDNLPFFVPIAMLAEGQTLIHDWSWENRAIYFTELNRLGAQITLADPHRVYIHGIAKDVIHPAQVVCPPALRPAMIVLIAMLAAKGTSVLRNVYSIKRGYEEVAERLNSIGADITILTD